MENFVQTFVELQLLFEDRHQHINGNGDPNLRLDRILAGPEKRLDSQMLLDPFEKQLYLPATFVQLGDRQGRQDKVVGQKDQPLVGFGIEVGDTPQGIWIGLGGQGAIQHDSLIAVQAAALVGRPGGTSGIIEVAFGADNEKRGVQSKAIETCEIDVASVENIEGAGLERQFVECFDVVGCSGSNLDKARDVAAQIQQGVHLYRGLGCAEARPGEQR